MSDRWQVINEQKTATIADAILRIESGEWTKWDALEAFTLKAPQFLINESQKNYPPAHTRVAYRMMSRLEEAMAE